MYQRTTIILHALLNEAGDDRVWADFVNKYQPRLHRALKQQGLQDADADDLTNELLGRFFERQTFKRFLFQGKDKFARWLSITARRAALTHFRTNRRNPDRWSVGHPDAQQALLQVTEQWVHGMTEVCADDLSVGTEVYAAVAARVDPATMQAFQMTALDGLPGKVVADKVGIPVGSVYQARSRVARLLIEELNRRQLIR